MSNLLHLLGTYPLFLAFVGQVVLMILSIKSGDRPSAVQGGIVAAAEAVISVAVALRPHTPPQPVPDLIASLGALFLLTPGFVGLSKLKQKQQKQGA